jgi:hypothetical protein
MTCLYVLGIPLLQMAETTAERWGMKGIVHTVPARSNMQQSKQSRQNARTTGSGGRRNTGIGQIQNTRTRILLERGTQQHGSIRAGTLAGFHLLWWHGKGQADGHWEMMHAIDCMIPGNGLQWHRSIGASDVICSGLERLIWEEANALSKAGKRWEMVT